MHAECIIHQHKSYVHHGTQCNNPNGVSLEVGSFFFLPNPKNSHSWLATHFQHELSNWMQQISYVSTSYAGKQKKQTKKNMIIVAFNKKEQLQIGYTRSESCQLAKIKQNLKNKVNNH